MCWRTTKQSYAKGHLDFVVKDTRVHPTTIAGIGEGAPRNSNTGLCYIENESAFCLLQVEMGKNNCIRRIGSFVNIII